MSHKDENVNQKADADRNNYVFFISYKVKFGYDIK